MKRVLALVLTVVMLVSCMVFTSLPASAAAKVHSVTLSNCDYTLDGWSGFSIPHDDLVIPDQADSKYLVKQLKAGTFDGWAAISNFSYTAPEPYDITGGDYLVLEFYIQKASAWNAKYVVELSTATGPDAADEWQRELVLSELAEGGWKDGWNTIKIPLNGGNFTKTNWRWLRCYSNPNTVSEDTLIGIKSMKLQKGEELVTISSPQAYRKGWGSAMQTRFDNGRTYVGRTLTGSVGGNGAVMYFNRLKAYTDEADQTIDVSFAKYLCFDLYVSDAAAIKDVDGFFVELNSAGAADQDERQWTKSLNAFSDYQLKDGWNHIMIGLDNEQFVKQTANDIDWTKVCWLRITNNNGFDLGDKKVDIGLDNIYFWDGYTDIPAEQDYETIIATGWKNDPYIIESDGAGKHDADFTFSDGNSHVTLKFDIVHAATAKNVYLQTKTGSQLKLEVSTDNQNWKQVAEYTENVVVQTRYYDISNLVDFSSSKTLYVKYSDSVPSNGNGGRMYNCRIDVAYEVIEEVDPSAPVIHACDTASAIGGGWVFDDEIEGALGKGCVTKTFKGNVTNVAGFNFQVKIYETKAGFWDTTDFEAVVFDLYVSNAAALKDTTFDIEFTSGKNPDSQENATNAKLSSFVAEGTEWKDGWNTLVVPFSKLTGVTGGGLKRENFNYIRIFNSGASASFNAGEGLVVAWDNIHLWDGEGSIYGSGRYMATKVQGFSVFTGSTTNAKYDALHPDDANANVSVDAFSKEELKYLVFTNAPSNGTGGNNGRYHNNQTYSIWKFDTKDALSAKFIVTCWNQMKLSVSKDMTNWEVVYDTGTTDRNTIARETRTFDLTQYIDGDAMYVKAEDGDPSNEYGFYVAPTGTYFVTTMLKDNDTSNKADVETSFTLWAADGKYADYVVSEWWSGKTGSDSHPFFDRGHGSLQAFGGPQIVFAFPTNPNNKYAAVNLQLSSNAMIEISKDFVNWQVYTEKTNYSADGHTAAWLDISDYVGGTDMIYIRVRSPMDMDDNGPQIWLNAPIGFTSQNEAPEEEILWDDCSNGDNVVSLFTYNEELNGIGYKKASGETTKVALYGKAGANPIDVRFMKWFEFDVYVSDPFPKGYNNQYFLELLDAPNSSDKHEIQYGDFVINQGWNHVVLPLPGNYVRSKSGSTGAIDMSAITSFRFFSTTEETGAEYTLAIKNVKFSRTMYVPNADWNHMTPNDTDMWAKETKGFTFDIGDANVVELDVYSANPATLGGNDKYGMFIEITSAGACDSQEQQTSIKDYVLKAGWNHLIIPLKDNTVDAQSFDRTNVNYVRVHGRVGSGNKWSVRNIKFTHNDVLDADINMFAKLGDRPVIALDNGTFSLDLSGDQFVAFDLYLQDPELFMTNGGFMALELTSSNKCDVEEYQFTFGAPETHTYPNSIDVSGLTAGWNRIILPLADALVTKGPVNDAAINYLRIHLHCNNAGSTAGAGWVAVRDFEGVGTLPVVELVNDQGEVSFVLGGVEGTIISAEELVPSITFEALEEGDVYDAIVDALYEANEDVFENYEVEYSASAILLDDAEGIFVVDDVMLVKLGTLELDGDQTYALYTIEDGELVEVENEILEEGGLTFEADEFKAYYIVAAMLQSKAGTTALTDFEVTNTDEVFEEGTVVHVDVIKQSDADQELWDTIQESLEDFQEEYEATLTPKEMTSNKYTYSTVAIYDVYALKDMAEVQPSGAVKMSIPAPALTAFETAKLFHVHDDGTKEEVEYTVNGNRWEFELDGFSSLVIVKVTAEPVTNPYTGDTLVVYIGLAVISMIALAGCAVLFVKKRKNNA